MSNEFKPMPLVATLEMKAAGRAELDRQDIPPAEMQTLWFAMSNAAPQPLAFGGGTEEKLIKLAAELANRRPLRPLQDLCDRQKSISTAKLIEDVEMCGDTLAAIAIDIRNCVNAIRAPLQAEIERLTKYAEAEAKGADSVAEDLLKWTSDNRKLRKERGQLKARCNQLEALLRESGSRLNINQNHPLVLAIDAALSKPAGSECCTPTAEEKALLAAGDYTPEELWGGSKPICPKCIGRAGSATE